MRNWKDSLTLWMVLCICVSCAAPYAARAEELTVTLTFSDGTGAVMERLPGETDSYWASVPRAELLLQARVAVSGAGALSCVPASGSMLDFPDAGNDYAHAAYVPLQLIDGQGQAQRTLRLYLSVSAGQSAAPDTDAEKRTVLSARLSADAPLLDAEGNPHPLAGSLAKDTLVRLTSVRSTAAGLLYRVDLNGENAYLPESVLTFTQDESGAALSLEDMDFSYAVTIYEAGIRSGKGNNDKNLLARAPKNTLVMVYAQLPDDDGKLLDFVYCPDLKVFGYVHDTQLKALNEEEAAALFFGPKGGQDTGDEFQPAQAVEDTQLYSFPDLNSAAVTALKAGQTVFLYTRIEGTADNWYLAQAEEMLGYVREDAVRLVSSAQAQGLKSLLTEQADASLLSRYATVDVSQMLLYTSPSLNADTVGRLSQGDLLLIQDEVTGEDNIVWYQVNAACGTGYVLKEQTERLLLGSYLLGQAPTGEV